MVKKLVILGFILTVFAAAGLVWAESYTGAIPAPQPMVMPASAPMCGPAGCPPPVMPKVKMKPKKLTTSIQVKMQYPAPPMPPLCGPVMAGCGAPPPIPVAVPMWKFVVPWPPFVYYLPVQ